MAKTTKTETTKTTKTTKTETTDLTTLFIKEGFAPEDVESALALGMPEEITRNILNSMKVAAEKKVANNKAKKDKEKAEKEARSAEIEAALVRICGATVPEHYNSIRDEKRFAIIPKKMEIPSGREVKKDEKGEAVKYHDRDLCGIRFESEGFNFCFQVEVPFSRRGKLDFTAAEHAAKKDELLGRIHAIIAGSFTEKGEFISL